MSVEDCGNVELPPWSYSVPSLNSEQEDPSDPASKIASLLLAKLADYVVPGEQVVVVRCPLPGDSQTKLLLVPDCGCASHQKREGEEPRAIGEEREEERFQSQCSPWAGAAQTSQLFLCLCEGCQTVLSPTASEPDTTLAKTSPKSSLKGDKDPGEESEAVDGKLSIFIHKREDQSSHEVLQPLLR